MIAWIKNRLFSLANVGTVPSDSEKVRLHKRFLVYVALLMTGGGLLWGTICVVQGMYLSASVPFGYIVFTIVNLVYFSRSKRLDFVRFFQLLLSLVLPFIFQITLGGFVPSGSVMLWSMTAILGALTFQDTRITLRWFVGYLALTAVSGVLDGDFTRRVPPVSSTTVSTLFVLNIIGVSTIVFGLMMYFVRKNELSYRELELTHAALVDSQTQLVQAEKMASLGSLTAGIAHEMNTPVGVINSNVDVSGRCIANLEAALANHGNGVGNNEQVRRSLDLLQNNNRVIADCSTRISRIVHSLKTFARHDEADFQVADLHEGINSTLDLLRHDFSERIELVTRFGDIPRVSCFPGELNQVFMNLVKNAVEAIGGPGRITIQSFARDNRVHIRFEDTGAGIEPDQLQRIFEPALTRTGQRVKAGLGLFTSYKIVEKHNGEIQIESEVGKGTSVTVVLPVA